ncbi:MAG TPA: hypothetical protein VFV38_39800 [Ktedonobacteraceae bacterium]|nr:hypothetical protein [Ktedonobacteraceae bacterium]
MAKLSLLADIGAPPTSRVCLQHLLVCWMYPAKRPRRSLQMARPEQ